MNASSPTLATYLPTFEEFRKFAADSNLSENQLDELASSVFTDYYWDDVNLVFKNLKANEYFSGRSYVLGFLRMMNIPETIIEQIVLNPLDNETARLMSYYTYSTFRGSQSLGRRGYLLTRGNCASLITVGYPSFGVSAPKKFLRELAEKTNLPVGLRQDLNKAFRRHGDSELAVKIPRGDVPPTPNDRQVREAFASVIRDSLVYNRSRNIRLANYNLRADKLDKAIDSDSFDALLDECIDKFLA